MPGIVRMTETYLTDELAQRALDYADELPEARRLVEFLEGRWGRNDDAAFPRRLAVRGLTGSARGYLASWLQRATDRTRALPGRPRRSVR